MGPHNSKRLRRALGAGLCCAGLALAGVLGATDGAPMPPIDPPPGGGAAVLAGLADGGVPAPPASPGSSPAPVPPAPW